MSTDCLFPCPVAFGRGSSLASDALSSTGTSPQTALRRKYEALSGRTPSAAEIAVLAQLCSSRLDGEPDPAKAGPAKAERAKDTAAGRRKRAEKHTPSEVTRLQLAGPRPEALAHLAVTLAAHERSVLFVSPHEGLLHERHHKFARRLSSRVLSPDHDEALESAKAAGGVAWCSTAALAALVAHEESWARALAGYDLVVIEAAESLAPGAATFSPALIRFGRALASELAHLPALFGSSYDAVLPAVRIEEAFPTSTLIVREAHGLDLSAELESLPRPLLALCSTPAEVDAVFAELSAGQVPVHRYHRGMSRAERARELVRFALPGRRAILVATSGLGGATPPEEAGSLPLDFGRGYARGDLRSIVHLSVPASLAEYTAELGLLHTGPRPALDVAAHDEDAAGPGDAEEEPTLDRERGSHGGGSYGSESHGNERDEELDAPERVAVLYFDRAQRSTDPIARAQPDPAVLLGAHSALVDGPLELDELARRLHHTPSTTLAALRALVESGLARRLGGAYQLLDSNPGELEPWLELASERSIEGSAHRELAWSFALGDGCRTATLADVLGFSRVNACRCDVCSLSTLPLRHLTDVPRFLGARPRAGTAPRQHASLPATRGPGVIRAVSRARLGGA